MWLISTNMTIYPTTLNLHLHLHLHLQIDVLDNDHDGRIDGLEFIGGLALCCQGTFEEKAKFCFEIYDFNLNAGKLKLK